MALTLLGSGKLPVIKRRYISQRLTLTNSVEKAKKAKKEKKDAGILRVDTESGRNGPDHVNVTNAGV